MPGAAARKKKRAAMHKRMAEAVDDVADAIGDFFGFGGDSDDEEKKDSKSPGQQLKGGSGEARATPSGPSNTRDISQAQPAGSAKGRGQNALNVNVHVMMLNHPYYAVGSPSLRPQPFAATGAVLGFPVMPPAPMTQPLIMSVVPSSSQMPGPFMV
mmetsp:Transcript_10761/g.26666  ORF Transcript_10761/g.26666 Transcript_10761/m.26666 type:complete len:156 (+) Transcript_10761:31-498(+)